MSPVLVTGAAGFIGSHACAALQRAGYAVRGVDNFDPFYNESEKRANLVPLLAAPGFSFTRADVRDVATMTRLLDGCEAIAHCAARPGVRDSWRDADLYQAINVEGTAALLLACERAGVHRLVFASSSSVYGDGQAPFVEDAAPAPCSPYAESKAAAEAVCRAFARAGGTVAVVRLFSVYGPRLRPDLAIRRFVDRIARHEPVPRFGNGSSRRDYTHVSDAVAGLLSALDWTAHGRPCCEIFNVGSGRPVALTDLIALLGEVMDRPVQVAATPEQRGDVRCTWADLSKSARSLSYRPKVTLFEGLTSVRRWFEESYGHPS